MPPRARSELACELAGLLTCAVVMPAAALLHTRDFVSLRRSYDWLELAVAAICIAIYAWPHTWPRTLEQRRRRMLWWAVPVIPAAALLAAGVALRHPYLDPFRDDRQRLAAERVLDLESNVLAAAHADWVVAYAESLEGEDPERAAELYRAVLRLDPTNEDARGRAARLDPDSHGRARAVTPDGEAWQRALARRSGGEGDTAPRLPVCPVRPPRGAESHRRGDRALR